MSEPEHIDTPWEIAVAWVLREHETFLDQQDARELEQWLQADLRHRDAYREATRLWLALGFIPTAEERR